MMLLANNVLLMFYLLFKAESEGDAWVNAALWFDAASG